MVKEVSMGQSAAKHPEMDEGSSTIPKGSRTPSGSEMESLLTEEDIVWTGVRASDAYV